MTVPTRVPGCQFTARGRAKSGAEGRNLCTLDCDDPTNPQLSQTSQHLGLKQAHEFQRAWFLSQHNVVKL